MRKFAFLLPVAAILSSPAFGGALSISLDTTDFHASKSAASGPITSSDADFFTGPMFPNGGPFAGATASANYGQLKVETFNGEIPGPFISSFQTNQTAQASYQDSATIGAPADVTGGQLTFSFTLDGSEQGSVGGNGLSRGLFDFSLAVTQNGNTIGSFHGVRDRVTDAEGLLDSDSITADVNGQGDTQISLAQLFSTWTITVPFVAADGPLSFTASALCRSRYERDLPVGPGVGGHCDAAHTITWGGVVASLNQNGQAFTGLSLIGSNGFNYALGFGQQPAPAPEPAALALFGLGVAGVGLRRRSRLSR